MSTASWVDFLPLRRRRHRVVLLVLLVVLAAGCPSARAGSGQLPPCSKAVRATVNPSGTPTTVDVNSTPLPIAYTVSSCDLGERAFPVEIEGLPTASAVSGMFRSEGDGVASLQLHVNRAAIPPGSTPVRIRIRDDHGHTVRTSILTLTLQRHSRELWAWLLMIAGGLGATALFVVRQVNEDNHEHWYSVRVWGRIFQEKATFLAITAGVGAAFAVFFDVYSPAWALGEDWWSTLLKIGGSFLGAATAASAAGKIRAN